MDGSTLRAGRTATEALRILWEDGFFLNWEKKSSIAETLESRGNHFSDAELGMALVRAKHLTRRGARGSYEYIQKYPSTLEASAPVAGTTSKAAMS
jgi:hypothetical protein